MSIHPIIQPTTSDTHSIGMDTALQEVPTVVVALEVMLVVLAVYYH